MSMSLAPSPLHLVVDANVLVRHALSENGRALLVDDRIYLLMTEYTFAEFHRHIGRRVQERARAERLTSEQSARLLLVTTTVADIATFRVSPDALQSYETEARRRIPDDWHTAALALAYGAAIWTEDKHFWGCGIAVWTTQRWLAYLAAN